MRGTERAGHLCERESETMMQTTFGQFNPDGGEGFLRPFYFPSLATMDSRTGDGRLLRGDGGGVYGNTLPRSIMAQFSTSFGHDGAEAVGTLQEVTFHEDGNISGKGWLADVPNAHLLVTLAQTGSLFHNSVDLADVEVVAEWESDDPEDPGFWNLLMDFTKWGIATTTIVNVPAFANARSSPDAPSEITASAMLKTDEPIEIRFAETALNVVTEHDEVTAAITAGTAEPFDAYHRPEPTVYTKHTVDEHGNVYGHLAPWGRCHDGIQNKCVIAPHPSHYGDFHQGTVLTDRGLVDTGVIFFLGGHPDNPLGRDQAHKAYGGVENTWAKVRVTNGRLGPWYCGRVLTGLSAEALELARATPISGHWRTDDTLGAIISVNVRGYNIPGTDRTFDTDGVSFDSEGRRHDLVASLHAPPAPERPDAQSVADMLASLKGFTSMTPLNTSAFQIVTTNNTGNPGRSPEVVYSTSSDALAKEALAPADDTERRERRLRVLELELDLDLDD